MTTSFSILEIHGIPRGRRDRVKAAVMAGSRHLPEGYEGWIVPARRPPGYALRVIGPRGFYREVKFTGHESEDQITECTREALSVSMAASGGAA